MASRPASKDPTNLISELANRAAALAFASAFMVVVAMVSFPGLVRRDSAVGRRIGATATLIVAVVTTGFAWRARARLRAARQASERPTPPGSMPR